MQTYFWQQSQWQALRQRIDTHKLPHALLLQGQAGLGKLQFAQACAAYLLCSGEKSSTACGVCRACNFLAAATHPDVCIIQTQADEKILKVDAIRHATEFLQQTPQFSGYKIVIIADAAAMNRAASNALLKTLEEPNANSLLLLCTAQPGRLLATIRSRCQVLHFSVPTKTAALSWLNQQTTASADDNILLNLAAGAPLLAQQYAMDSALIKQRQTIFEQFKSLSEGKLTLVQCSELWSKVDLAWLLKLLTEWVMDIWRILFKIAVHNDDLEKDLQDIAARVQSEKIWDFYQELLQQMDYVLRSANLNAQLSVEHLLLQWLNNLSNG